MDGCPHNGPALAVDGNKKYFSWFTGKEGEDGIYFGVIENGKTTQKKLISQDGGFTQMAVSKDGTPLIVYSEYYEKDNQTYMQIMLAKPMDNDFQKIRISNGDANANHPMIQILNENEVLIGWSEDNKAVYKKVSLSEFK